MTLTDRIDKIKQEAAAIMAGNPEIHSITYEINDVPLAELEAYPKENKLNYDYDQQRGMMRLMITNWGNPYITIFAYSKKVRVVKPEVCEVEA